MLGIIGKKIGMTSIFNKRGENFPCTIIQAGPCIITQIKTPKKDGYSSIQLAFENKKLKNTTKALIGHFKKSCISPKKKLVEFIINNSKELKLGDEIKVNIFSEKELVNITGISKGKGFQGVVKRHGFSGVGERTHGQHNRSRSPGSIGAGSDPSRVFKGTRMGGRMGNKYVTIQNLEILKVNIEKNIILIKGSVPGHKKSYLIIKKWS